jgi:hypothetical protein
MQRKQKYESDFLMTSQGENYLVINDEECYSVVHDHDMSWVVDTCASFHITQVFHVIYLQHYWPCDKKQCSIGNW